MCFVDSLKYLHLHAWNQWINARFKDAWWVQIVLKGGLQAVVVKGIDSQYKNKAGGVRNHCMSGLHSWEIYSEDRKLNWVPLIYRALETAAPMNLFSCWSGSIQVGTNPKKVQNGRFIMPQHHSKCTDDQQTPRKLPLETKKDKLPRRPLWDLQQSAEL